MIYLVNFLQGKNFILLLLDFVYIVDKHGFSWTKKGVCGHTMAGFDQHAHCARCRDNKKGTDPYVKGNVCPSCNILTEEQKLRLATPVYQNKKEKCQSKTAE